MDHETKRDLDYWLSDQTAPPPSDINNFIEHGFLINEDADEFSAWSELLYTTRNEKAHVFTFHFEPTLQCQFRCSYCFENGIDRGQPMRLETLKKSLDWFREYLRINSGVDSLRLKFFGGEPLLHEGMVAQTLKEYSALCRENKLDLSIEITTNGELLNERVARLFSQYNWHRVQITLDGPADIHDMRRHGVGKRPTYTNIMKNVCMLLLSDYIPTVDIRMTLDAGTKDHLARLIDELDAFGNNSRIHLSLGLTTPSLSVTPGRMTQEQLAKAALSVWRYAKTKGFEIPDEFTAGPLCVATAKHAAVLQPDGNLQKCFCTSGREEFNFSHVTTMPTSYTKDTRFEQWERFEECIKERCTYLPICGGGCAFEAMVRYGTTQGSAQRFCQKTLLDQMNRGLLVLAYS
ncbi:MAG: radical SAM protein [Minisyncoccota bacterium]